MIGTGLPSSVFPVTLNIDLDPSDETWSWPSRGRQSDVTIATLVALVIYYTYTHLIVVV